MFANHWTNIDAVRIGTLRNDVSVKSSAAHFYLAAKVDEGHPIAAFGYNPGHVPINKT